MTGNQALLALAQPYVYFAESPDATCFFSTASSATLVGSLLCIAYCVPVFFAGVIFTETFRRQEGRSEAFGANMLGAVAGGLAQNLSFIFGMKALLLVAVAVYGGAAILEMTSQSQERALAVSPGLE